MTLIYIFRLCLYINQLWHIIAMYIYSLNKYIRCSVFLFSERVTALYCSSRVFATWRELCKFLVDSQKFTDASTVSSDIFEDYKVYISSKLTFIIFFWFLFRSLGYFNCGYFTGGKNIVKKWVTLSRRLFFLQSTYFLIMFFICTNRCGDCNVLATLFALLSVMLHRLLKQSN